MRSAYCATTYRNPIASGFTAQQRAHIPAANVQENKDNFVIELLAPGRNKEDFKISLEQNKLTVSYAEEATESNQSYSRKEFFLKPFKRSFVLPEIADKENISAQYLNGILLLTIPKIQKGTFTRTVEVL